MAGRILKEDIDALRQQADIVAVIGDYTSLRRAGKSFKGLCPFHTERTPSFTCTPDGNFFHCFGCGASGDIYDFLQRVEGMDFPEAVETLARRTGFPLRYEQLTTRERRAIGERSRLVAVSHLARDHFVRRLLADEGTVARDYLKGRGFGRPEADAFELGFALEAWDDLSRALLADGVEAEDLIAIGVSVRNDRGGLRDRFRGRLIFPIHDPGGDVIGFGGRVLPEIDYGDFEPPKYLNSPETPLYHKSKVLYGVPQARSEIVSRDQVLICEGYTDVIALQQAGFANAVATCGPPSASSTCVRLRATRGAWSSPSTRTARGSRPPNGLGTPSGNSLGRARQGSTSRCCHFPTVGTRPTSCVTSVRTDCAKRSPVPGPSCRSSSRRASSRPT